MYITTNLYTSAYESDTLLKRKGYHLDQCTLVCSSNAEKKHSVHYILLQRKGIHNVVPWDTNTPRE